MLKIITEFFFSCTGNYFARQKRETEVRLYLSPNKYDSAPCTRDPELPRRRMHEPCGTERCCDTALLLSQVLPPSAPGVSLEPRYTPTSRRFPRSGTTSSTIPPCFHSPGIWQLTLPSPQPGTRSRTRHPLNQRGADYPHQLDFAVIWDNSAAI